MTEQRFGELRVLNQGPKMQEMHITHQYVACHFTMAYMATRCVIAYISVLGDGIGKNTHLSLFFMIMKAPMTACYSGLSSPKSPSIRVVATMSLIYSSWTPRVT